LRDSFKAELEVRSQFYALDRRDRDLIASCYEAVRAQLPQATAARFESIRQIPHYRDTLTKFGADLAAATSAHFDNVAKCRFDDDYVTSLLRLVEIQAASGFGVGTHLGLGPTIAELFWCAICARHRFSRRRIFQSMRAVTTLLYFDVANVSALHNRRLARSVQERADHLHSASSDFLNSIERIRSTLMNAGRVVVATSSQAVAATQRATGEADLTIETWNRATESISTMSRSADEISQSIGVICEETIRSRQAAREALQIARDSENAINDLLGMTSTIGSVTELIRAVAQRTRLVALNAAIEAARAGETGRGFSVVASEVKQLSAQITNATGDIEAQISRIHETTRSCHSGIEHLANAIQAMASMTGAITDMVTEHDRAASEIRRQAHETVAMTDIVEKSSHSIRDVVGGLAAAAKELESVSRALASHSDELGAEANRFIVTVKS
jgi:methyl-accepting chemotaxis protein